MSQGDQTARLHKSVTREVGAGDARAFPSFDDLAGRMVLKGEAPDIESIRTQRLDLWGQILFDWFQQGQVACVFAQVLARDPEKARWASFVVEGPWTCDIVNAVVETAAAEGFEAAQILFPGDGSVSQAVGVIRELCKHPQWKCEDAGWLDRESGDSVQVGLRWRPKSDSYESWVLGIAPFEPMPFTRRVSGAPFVALVLRPTAPIHERAEPKKSNGVDAAHLAHMDDGIGTDKAKRDKWTEATRAAKIALLNPEPLSRARARVTFSLPSWGREALKDELRVR